MKSDILYFIFFISFFFMDKTKNFRFTDSCNQYKIYICSGKGENRRETGNYSNVAESYLEACALFGEMTNHCYGRTHYGNVWKSEGQKEGNPKEHEYFRDNLGNELLLINRGKDRRYWN